MTRIVWKFSFTLYTSNDDSTFWKKYQFWLKNVSLFKKQLIGKVERFLKSNFDWNEEYKIELTQKPLNLVLVTELHCFIFTSWLEKCFELRKISTNSYVKETWPSSSKKLVFSDNPSKNIWHKLKKYSKIGQNFNNVIYSSLCFCQVLSTFNFCKGDWQLGFVSTHTWHFTNIF